MSKHKIVFEYEIETQDDDVLRVNVGTSLNGEELFESSASFRYLLQAIDDARINADMSIQLLKASVIDSVNERYAYPTCTNTLINGDRCTRDVAQRFITKGEVYQLCDQCADDLQIE